MEIPALTLTGTVSLSKLLKFRFSILSSVPQKSLLGTFYLPDTVLGLRIQGVIKADKFILSPWDFQSTEITDIIKSQNTHFAQYSQD